MATSYLLGPKLWERLMRICADAPSFGADEIELSFEGGRLGVTRFARSSVTQTGDVIERTLRARVRIGRRVASARVSSEGDAALVVRMAIEAARAQPDLPFEPRFPAPPAPERDERWIAGMERIYRGETGDLGAGDRAALLARALTVITAASCHAAGLIAIGVREQCVASTRGMRVYQRTTHAKLDVIATCDGDDRATGRATHIAHDAAQLDAAAMAEQAVETAHRMRGAQPLPPGEYDVVLEPPAVSELLEWMGSASFGSAGFLDGTSCLVGRQGERICSDLITIYDDGLDPDPAALVSPSDCEGVRKQRVTLIDRGVAGAPVLDSISAARLGGAAASTGHAPPLDDAWSQGSVSANLALAPGPDAAADLVARVERGLHIKRFHYVNGLIDTRRAVMTGMTRDGCFLIQDGKPSAPVANVRWTQSVLDALGRVGGISRERRPVPVWWSGGGAFLCPTLLLRGWRVTGGQPGAR